MVSLELCFAMLYSLFLFIHSLVWFSITVRDHRFFSAFHPGVKVGLNSPCCLICFSLPSVYVYQQHALQPTSTLTPLFHSVSNLIRVLSFLAALFCAGSCCCCSFDLMNSRYAHRRMGRSGNDSCCKIWITAHRNVSFFFFLPFTFFFIVCNVDQSSYYRFAVRLGWSDPRC